MNTVFSIFKQIKVKEVSYEVGDEKVIATCEINVGSHTSETKIIMSHTDLNRIIARIAAMGYDFKIDNINHFDFGDGTEVVDYKFENVFGEEITLTDFQFNRSIKQIRA
ncbi:MAG: hypothetical protein R2780_08240 [Crocinitomicaceae bacterium]